MLSSQKLCRRFRMLNHFLETHRNDIRATLDLDLSQLYIRHADSFIKVMLLPLFAFKALNEANDTVAIKAHRSAYRRKSQVK